jgi:hypothetical protein
MNCFKHNATGAVAVCVYCGRALCHECLPSPNAPRLLCSDDCAKALTRADQAMLLILQRSAQSAQASAFYCYISGGLSAAAAVVAWFMLPSPFLILFTGGCAVVLIVSGVWYGRGAKRQNADPRQ